MNSNCKRLEVLMSAFYHLCCKLIFWLSRCLTQLDWLHQVEYSTQKVSSWVEIFLKKCWVELRSWTQELKLNWEAWFDNSIQKLDLTQQDIK